MYQIYKRLRAIHNAKRHDEKFVGTPTCFNSNLWDIFLTNWHLLASQLQIYLLEHLSAMEMVHHLLWYQQWILILDRPLIQPMVIYTEPKATIFLWYK